MATSSYWIDHEHNNPEYCKYISSKAWFEKRGARLDMDNHKCVVCGADATDVHHLTYVRLGHEDIENDLVSLCKDCHNKAEELAFYKPHPYAKDTEAGKTDERFIAHMMIDAAEIAPDVYRYIRSKRGSSLEDMLALRDGKIDRSTGHWRECWGEMKIVINALCKKRYVKIYAENRLDMMTVAVMNRVITIALGKIEHYSRNALQADMQAIVTEEKKTAKSWKEVAERHGMKPNQMYVIKNDDGSSNGPTDREAVLFYLGMDALSGFHPARGFNCLTDEDYTYLNQIADHAMLGTAITVKPTTIKEDTMEITIKLAGLPEALHHLADAIQGRSFPAMTTTPAIVTEEKTPAVSAPPWDAPAEAPQRPVEAPAAPEEKKYTMDELGRAGAYLIDHGGMENLLKLLAGHNVRALTELKQDDYAQVADELRALGAEI